MPKVKLEDVSKTGVVEKEVRKQQASNIPGACRCMCSPDCECGCNHPHDCKCCEDCPCGE